MQRMMIRVDAEVTADLLSAFPHFIALRQRPQTMITGDVADQEELQGLLHLLTTLGIDVVDVVTLPER